MIEAAARWVARAVSLLLLGPLAARGAAMAVARDGSDAHTLLTGESLGVGLMALAVVAACVVTASMVAARLADRHEAVLNAGFVLGWVAWTGGSLDDVIRLGPEVGTLLRLSVEALALMLVVLLSWTVGDRLSRRDAAHEGLSLRPGAVFGALRYKAGLPVLGVSWAVAIACAWLFARYGSSGQGLGAAFIGGLGAGVFGSLVYQSVTKEDRAAPHGATGILAPALIGVLLAGVIAPLIGIGAPGAADLLQQLARGSLPGWVLVTPAAWMSGALIGVPAGASFLKSTSKNDAEGAMARAMMRF